MLWLLKCFLVFVDVGCMVIEVLIIIEYFGLNYLGLVCLLFDDLCVVFEVWMMDCFFDNYVVML